MVDPIAIKSPSLFWANLHEYNHSVVVGSFIAKKFFLPTLSDTHLTAHFLRVAGAQICICFGLQKHLSVSRFRFLFCKSSCCQPPKSICQSHVANFVSLISSLLPTFHPSVALNSFEISWNRNIVQNCPSFALMSDQMSFEFELDTAKMFDDRIADKSEKQKASE